ncbi:hypothetical protein BH23THE1_BH23THE1_34410 [soil metagenome]
MRNSYNTKLMYFDLCSSQKILELPSSNFFPTKFLTIDVLASITILKKVLAVISFKNGYHT